MMSDRIVPVSVGPRASAVTAPEAVDAVDAGTQHRITLTLWVPTMLSMLAPRPMPNDPQWLQLCPTQTQAGKRLSTGSVRRTAMLRWADGPVDV